MFSNQLTFLVVTLFLVCNACARTNFTQCRNKLVDLLTLNQTIPLDPNGTITSFNFADPIYHGQIRGFNVNAAPRPLTVTQRGCLDFCGSDTEWYNVVDAFSILTTWVLPIIGLLTSLPYESLSEKKRKNLEAFGNWIGAPAAALTTTIWNISMIQRCRMLVYSTEEPDMQPLLRDSLYVLSCINQYQYPRNLDHPLAYERRDIALLRGVLAPYVNHDEVNFPPLLRKKVNSLTMHLAFQLRLYRRKGVYPLWFSLIWFLLAFIFSIVIAFASLGDNTTAHSLALGLLLSWMPILVLATIIDRNPIASTRCGILIERWLYNIDALFTESRNTPRVPSPSPLLLPSLSLDSTPDPYAYAPSVSSSMHRDLSHTFFDDDGDAVDGGKEAEDALLSPPSQTYRSPRQQQRIPRKPLPQIVLQSYNQPSTHQGQWRKGASMTDFKIGEYVGQGRRMRYCAVTDTVLQLILDPRRPHLKLPSESDALKFRVRLPRRPYAWYITWIVSQVLLAVAYSSAFVVSFMTPTIGLGCRSLLYTIWYLFSFFSWVLLGIFQEPPQFWRRLAWIPNALATLFLFSIMFLQVTGALNTCVCKTSVFGARGWGGYMDFENAQFYHEAFGVKKVWATATGFGVGSCTFAISWFWRRWSKDSGLWRVTESTNNTLVDGVDLEWLT